MTKKVVNFWKQFSFWDKIRLTLGSIGVGGEVTMYFADTYVHWKLIAGGATIISIIVTYFFKDENKNNIVDLFE